MKKKLFAMLLTCAMLLGLLTVAALADDAAVPTSGTCGDNLTWVLDDTGTLTVSGTGPMDDFEYWSDDESDDDDFLYGSTAPWDDYRDSIRQIVLEDGVTSIGTMAFYECPNLTDVTIPESVTRIGSDALELCACLQSIEIPESVTEIGESAFAGCALQRVTVPGSVTTLGGWTFADCYALESVVIEEGVTHISSCMFMWCEALTSVTLPDSLTVIEWGAFDFCTGLEHITLPNSLTEIDLWAFEDCRSLESITIPGSVAVLEGSAFDGCTALRTVEIQNGVTEITNDTFSGCTSLETVSIPESVTVIGDHAFSQCTSLVRITIPDSVTAIGWGVFSDCTALEDVNLPAGLTVIDYDMFYSCTSLAQITIPDSVTAIMASAFADCSALTDVYYTGTMQQLSAVDVDDHNSGLDQAVIHFPGDDGSYTVSPFTDVQSITQYYFAPTLWAQDRGIACGTSAATFSPDDVCTRAEAVTFLYRAAGEPAVTGIELFWDVQEDDYYYDAVCWAYETGITVGTTEHTFSPDELVTRADFITFLCRYAGADYETYPYSYFEDVNHSQYFFDAVNWGYENGFVSGTDAYTFSPYDSCTRGQVVTFLFRYMHQTIADRGISPEPGDGMQPEHYIVRIASVSSGVVALRNADSADDGNVIDWFGNGEIVYVVDNTIDQYWYVYVPSLGKYGYVNSDCLK